MLVMLDGKTCSMMIVWHRLCDDKNDHRLIGTALKDMRDPPEPEPDSISFC